MKKKVIYKTIIVTYAIIGILSIVNPQLLSYTEFLQISLLSIIVWMAFAFVNLIFDKDEQDESDN